MLLDACFFMIKEEFNKNIEYVKEKLMLVKMEISITYIEFFFSFLFFFPFFLSQLGKLASFP